MFDVSVLSSPYVRHSADYIEFGWCFCVATFWIKAAQSVHRMIALKYIYLQCLIISHICLEDRSLVMIEPVLGRCLLFSYFLYVRFIALCLQFRYMATRI